MNFSNTQKTNTETSQSYILPLPPPPPPPPPLLPLPPPLPPPSTKRRAEPKRCLKMSSNCTITRLVRWRVKDLASCLYACRFPLEEETEGSSNVTPQKPNRSMVNDSRVTNTEQETRRKMAFIKKRRDENRNAAQISSRNKSNNTPPETKDGSATSDSSWPSFAEEDYIVFCFREDGAIHMINEGKPSEACDEIDEDKNNRTLHHIFSKEDEEGSNEAEMDCPPDEIKEIDPVEDSSAPKMDSFESCDSNLSDTSTSSFAFPVLGMEWIGSPVQMPRSDKHNKARNVHLHCCSF